MVKLKITLIKLITITLDMVPMFLRSLITQRYKAVYMAMYGSKLVHMYNKQ